MSHSTGARRARVLEASRRAIRPCRASAAEHGAARFGGTTDESVSSTSLIRSAQTAARGTIISMNVAIITDIRICTR